MSRPAECYAQAMLELQYPMDVVEQAQAIWECCPALSEVLTNPTISISGGSAESALCAL